MTADAPAAWLTLLRDLSVKSALLLLSAWALTFMMRRTSASTRHLVWLLVFAGLLALPLLSLTLPARPVLVLPAAPVAAAVSTPIAAAPPAVPDKLPAPSVAATSPAPSAPPARLPLLCLFWLLGAVLFSVPVILGLALAGKRIRSCRPVADPAVLALAAEAARRLGVRRPVLLRSGPAVSVPVTFGLMRPVILLPDGAASWPAERLRVALLHELAHVKRGDWATQTAARLVCALFWHNPLIWPAARMLRAEAERACDDLVLSCGIPAPDYAQHLLAVAAALSGTSCPLPLAVPMAGRGSLESRLRAVLSSRPRRALTRPRVAFAFVLALFVLVPLAALRPAARAALRVAPLLSHAPVTTPAPPKTVRPFPALVKAALAAPPAPIPIKPTPIGVPPMKTLTPVKTVALAALAATLTLASAKAQAPAPSSAMSAASTTAARPSVSPPRADATTTISLAVNQTPVRDILAMLFKQEHLNYVITPAVTGLVSMHLSGVPLDVALNSITDANSQPLEWSIQGGVYHIQPRAVPAAADAPPGVGGTALAAPHQVQVRFEWVSRDPEREMDSLTVVAQEGHSAQASSQHIRNGSSVEETITVLPHVEPDGVVALDITERSDGTLHDSPGHAGETEFGSSKTTVRVKDGETGLVRSKQSKPGAMVLGYTLFVTPTIIRPSD